MAKGYKTGGRKPGSLNKATAEVRVLAGEHGPDAIKELARLAKGAESEAMRVSACNSLLERAYGRSPLGKPIRIELPDTSTVEGVSKAMAAVIQAAARGEITPGEARDLCSLIEAQGRIIELDDHETRLRRLEDAAARR